MSAADLVRDVRVRHGINQASLARRCRTSQTHISRIERGEVSPSAQTLERILQCMGERLELGAAPAARGNASDRDVREDVLRSPSEHLLDAAGVAHALTAIAATAEP